jgi:hypothetical protein
MIDWALIRALLFGETDHPPIPNLRDSRDDNLSFDGLTRGTVVIGNPGTGKTRWVANQAVRYCITYPDRPFISLDKSGSFTNDFISILASKEPEVQKQNMPRIILDDLGNDVWVVPYPMFSLSYGGTYDEQVQQAVENFMQLEPKLVDAPILGDMSVRGTGAQLFKLLTGISDIRGETWQLTEAKRLLTNPRELRQAAESLPDDYQSVKDYFLKEYLVKVIKPGERELRTYALRMILNKVDTRFVRARLGYYKPGYTIHEVLRDGKILLVSGERLNNQDNTQHFLFTQLFASIISEINRREPHDPREKPLPWFMDEVYTFFEISGMAEKLAKISPLYRSRKVEPVVVTQGLWQFAEVLRSAIWSFGNWVVFGVDNFEEAYEIAQQKFTYFPKAIKLSPRTETQQPVIEPDRGQYLTAANWIQGFNHRECVMSLYETEQNKEPNVRHISRTKDILADTSEPLEIIKERLLRVRAVSIREAIDVVLQRELPQGKEEESSKL